MMKYVKLILFLIVYILGVLPTAFTLEGVLASAHQKIDPAFYESANRSSIEYRVIVKFKEHCTVEAFSSPQRIELLKSFDDYKNYLHAKQSRWIKEAGEKFPFTVRHTFQQAFNGLSLQIRGYHIRFLVNDPSIEKIWDGSKQFPIQRNRATETLSAKTVWKLKDTNNKSLTGKGVRIGVIDSGIDYRHPDFLDSSGKPSRIKGGKDFADKDDDYYDYGSTFKPGFYPHGTAVAGVIAGNNLKNPIHQGMAPESDLFIYKIYSNHDGSGSGDEIMASIEQSLIDQCHLLNLSLGNAYPAKSINPDDPLFTAIQNATKRGILFVCAAGNQGSRSNNGDFTIIVPSIYEPTLSVAGTDDRMNVVLPLVHPDGNIQRITCGKITHTPPFPRNPNATIVDCGFGGIGDFRKVDVKGKIALVSRGPKSNAVSFKDKNLNAKNAGAIAVITYNFEDSPLHGYLLEGYDRPENTNFLPNAELSGMNAAILKSALNQGAILQLPEEITVTLYDQSSAGPCLSGDDGIFKPDICAPSKQISSCEMSVNQYNEKVSYPYGESDGTSLGCPAATGVIALIKQAHPDLNAMELKALVMNCADIINNPYSGTPFSFLNQGSGQINALSSLQAPLITQPPYLMKRYEKLEETNRFELRNLSNQTVTARLSFEVFGEIESHQSIQASFSDNELTLPVGGKKSFTITFQSTDVGYSQKRKEGVIWIQTDQSKQHIPVIITKGRITDRENTITDISISSSQVDVQNGSSMMIRFTINAGNRFLISGMENAYDWRDNCFETFMLSVFDESRHKWGTIFYAENLFVGSYRIPWNGKDIHGNEFLPNGKYRIVCEMNGIKYNMKNDMLESVEDMPEIVELEPIRVQNSSLPDLPLLIISSPDKIKIGSEFVLDILFVDAGEVTELDLTLTFSKSSTTVLRYSLSEFVDQSKFNSGKNALLDEGIFTLHVKRDPRMTKKRLSVAQVRLKADSLSPKTGLILNFSLPSNENAQTSERIQVEYPLILLQKKEFQYGDFNQDQLINYADWVLLQEKLFTSYTDTAWDPAYDLNNDYLVDLSDMAIFSRYYEND